LEAGFTLGERYGLAPVRYRAAPLNGVTGAGLPRANVELLPWVSSFEEPSLVLAHNSLVSAQRNIDSPRQQQPDVTLSSATPGLYTALRGWLRSSIASGR
jgi:hypothetical protein